MSLLPPNTLPRITNSPYDDPKVFADTWGTTMALIEGASGATGDSSALLAAFLKNGRISGISPTLPPSPSLTVTLPDGFQWVQDGQLITVDGDTSVGTVPQNFDGYASLTATWDDGIEDWDYQLSTSTTKPAAGTGIIAKVTSDTTTVTAIDTTEAETDVILTMPDIVSRLSSLTGGGSGGAAAAELLPWQLAPGDTRDTVTVVTALLEALSAELTDMINSGGNVKPMQQITDILTHELAIARQSTIALQPPAGERSASANIEKTVEGIYGDGSDGHPDHLLDSTMDLNEDGEFEA